MTLEAPTPASQEVPPNENLNPESLPVEQDNYEERVGKWLINEYPEPAALFQKALSIRAEYVEVAKEGLEEKVRFITALAHKNAANKALVEIIPQKVFDELDRIVKIILSDKFPPAYDEPEHKKQYLVSLLLNGEIPEQLIPEEILKELMGKMPEETQEQN